MTSTPIDPDAILAAFGVSAHSATPVVGGADTALWRVRHEDETYALRVFRPHELARYRAEQEAMRLADEAGVPVPRVVEAGLWQAFPALLLTWCPGRPLAEALRQQPWRVWELGKVFGRMQARLHSVTLPPEVSIRGGRWVAWQNDDLALQAALDALPAPSRSLLHLDFHPLNVLVDGGRVSGIIDWANVHIGDPRADFARTHTILCVEPWTATPSRIVTALRWLLEKAWRSGYQEVAGTQHDLPLFYAWAGTVMVNDLAHRVGQPGSWFQERHLETIRRWTRTWRQHAGLPA